MIDIGELVDDRYRVTASLGEGGMAEVFEAQDIITKKMVALKIIKDEVMKNPLNIARFEREARASAALNHPNIIRVINLGVYNGHPYMANELVKGVTLEEALETRQKFTYAEAIDIMDQLLTATQVAHAHLVIHRDIKPSNIYMTPQGMIKLGDFGIATFENAVKVTKSQDIVGSAHYLAPEISQGKASSIQSDIYALGITFFEIITGRLPFDGNSNLSVAIMHIKDRFPSPRKYLPSCPKALEKIIMKACKKNPAERYKTALEMQKEIQKIKNNPKLMQPHHNFLVRFFGFATDE